jgi:hypothetical protein
LQGREERVLVMTRDPEIPRSSSTLRLTLAEAAWMPTPTFTARPTTDSICITKRLSKHASLPGKSTISVNPAPLSADGDSDDGPDTSSTQARKDSPLRKSKKEAKTFSPHFLREEAIMSLV